MENDYGKDNAFDIDNDPEFSANFYKNIEKALENVEISEELTETSIDISGIIDVQEAREEEQQQEEDAEEEAQTEPDQSAEPGAETAATASAEAEAESESSVDEELIDINSLLAKQISEELDIVPAEEAPGKKENYFILHNTVLLALLCLLGFGFFLGFTRQGNGVLMSAGINISGAIWEARTNDYVDNTEVGEDIDYIEEDDLESDAEEIDTDTIIWPNHTGEGRKEEGVYNILVLGEEAIGQGAGRGRTDVIIIATINTNDNSLKLTSLMRDMLVQIPNFKENKLNVVYEEGGIDLLYKTISKNLNVHLDGSVLVNFKNFEMIIDELGGLEITLTAAEAKYLRTTNYISNTEYRNVVEGKQLMNGNQVLGYSRVRKRAAITGNNNDYGRTDRHRIILNAIFEKCKSKSKVELAAMMYKFLPMIRTDIDNECFEALLDAYLKTGATRIEQLRIPANGTFKDNIKVRGMSVLIPDYDINTTMLHDFIFGKN